MYFHMLIVALEFMLYWLRPEFQELYSHACRESRAAGGTWISTHTATNERGPAS
jgi:hypothetical protein